MAQMFFSAWGLKGVQTGRYRCGRSPDIAAPRRTSGRRDRPRDGRGPALHTAEFSASAKNNTGSFPRGLGLMLRLLTNWLYDRDPFTPLALC